ncbi:UNVERIFIED_CONTAM: Retrovirus-related Pol polyprotein from transposon RE2 [Sesamum latifolium]|uniref:Retrovirus-related Pol polyprotein from transposon RE2 n=1 Tax=Sesamum latifolium TaxID=2727402 RepID=A0AAW2X548_9LAMI
MASVPGSNRTGVIPDLTNHGSHMHTMTVSKGGSYVEQFDIMQFKVIKHRRLVQDGNRHQIPYPRLRSGDCRGKDSTLMDSRPKISHGHSPKFTRRKHSVCCPVHQARYRLRFERNEQISGMRQVAHWGTIKSILKYLKRTKDIFLIYGGGELILEGYSDASFQSDDNDAKSQSGFVFKLNNASEAAKEAIWIKNYIQELGVVPSIAEPVVIFYDNNGAIAQAKKPRSHYRSKHILRRYHLLTEMVSRGDCRMDRVSSAENTADPLTKPMSQVAQHLDKMGLRSMGDWL